MQLKLSFASATALALLMTAAHADSNFANVEQNGSSNSGVITQGPGRENKVGTPDNLLPGAALQDGSNNGLSVLQSGNFNQIGTRGQGFDQSGKRNQAAITQSSDRNTVGEVQQVDEIRNGFTLRNTLTIHQRDGNGNSIDSVRQTRTGSLFTDGQAGNVATITQGGSLNHVGTLSQAGRTSSAVVTQTGNRNELDALRQNGNANEATLEQLGNSNKVGAIAQGGGGNRASATFAGARNGTHGFETSRLGSGAFASLSQGDIRQNGLGNTLHFSVAGNGAAFSFDQDGIANEILATVGGNDNQIGVGQDGTANQANILIASGNSNDVYIAQTSGAISFGDDADVSIAGNSNGIGIAQDGNRNTAIVGVAGNANLVTVTQASLVLGNTATVEILHGSDNTVDIDQDNYSRAGVTVQGNRNNVDFGQTGNNDATVSVLGNRNIVSGSQTSGLLGNNVLKADIAGNRNGLKASQWISGGGTNTASVSFTGNENYLDVTQSKSGVGGSGNMLNVSLYGNRNNDPALGGFGSASLAKAGTLAGSIVGSSFGPGTIYQAGKGNTITLDVGTATSYSNGNLFAFAQSGNTNGIVGSINGNGNQAVVAQSGDGNFTSFSQIGNFNVVGISQ